MQSLHKIYEGTILGEYYGYEFSAIYSGTNELTRINAYAFSEKKLIISHLIQKLKEFILIKRGNFVMIITIIILIIIIIIMVIKGGN